jgi:hypothetical protein
MSAGRLIAVGDDLSARLRAAAAATRVSEARTWVSQPRRSGAVDAFLRSWHVLRRTVSRSRP